ncbi:ABC transporter permease subunit [Desulfovibrio sp. OttesenSCG-928-A18]|nr:ABC transporter permease subunit [Desulfovibrio sp. OttesenSCG-928-A18]
MSRARASNGAARPAPRNRLRGLPLLRFASRFAAVALLGCLGALFAFLLFKGGPVLDRELLFGNTPSLDAILGLRPVWDGIWPALAGTLCLVLLTLCLALFPGIGCGVYLAEYAGPRAKALAGAAVDVLAGVPSIVMGLFGFTVILFLRRSFLPEANTCLFLASACLALLVLPVLIVSTREALEAVPRDLRLCAAALGLSRAARLRHVLLPVAARGIWSGVILALGRSAEDTAVIMLTGVVANAGLPAGLGAKFEALPFAIYYITAQYQSQEELARAFGASLVLLLLAGGLMLLASRLASGYRRRWAGGKA